MTEPTDAELLEVIREAARGGAIRRDGSTSLRIARAVLAKWGTPAPVGEVVACGNCGGSGRMVRDPDIGTDQECFVCDGSGSFSEPATPRPTQPQAGAVPLTDEQIGSLACVDGLANIEVPALQWLVREVEYLHGIKGGQHGTKT